MVDEHQDFYILHGEDDVVDVRVMDILLEEIGYKGRYLQIESGDKLLAQITQDKLSQLPGLIILDIGLPGTDGKEILSILRQDELTKGIPILMMSGSNSMRDYRECISLGANAYIQKTPSIEDLTAILGCFVEGWLRLSRQTFY